MARSMTSSVLLLSSLFLLLCAAPAQADKSWCDAKSLKCLAQARACGGVPSGIATKWTPTPAQRVCIQSYLDCCAICNEPLIQGANPAFADTTTLTATAMDAAVTGEPFHTVAVGFYQGTNLSTRITSPASVGAVRLFSTTLADFEAHTNATEMTWVPLGDAMFDQQVSLWTLNVSNAVDPQVLRADMNLNGEWNNFAAALLLGGTNAADCCANCVAPFPASLAVNVPAGYSFLVNPLCHGAGNALGSILSGVPDSTTVLLWDEAIQAYGDPLIYDLSGLGGWFNSNTGSDPSNSPLPPGKGFALLNPGPAFTLTFIGCEPECGSRCPTNSSLSLVGRTGSATGPVHWEDVFNCPPVCGSLVQIFNGSSFDTYTFLGSGWSPTTPTWAAGTSVFVGRTNCDPCTSANLLINGSFEDGAFNNNGDDCQTMLNGSTAVTGWTVINDQAARCQSGVLSGVTASQGNKLMDLTGYDNVAPHAGVTQTVPTTTGQCYRLSFDLGANPEIAGLGGPITVRSTAGTTVRTFTHHPGGSGTVWSNFGFTFTASGASTAITIEGLSANLYFIGLDNVVLTRSCDCTNDGCPITMTCPPDLNVANAPGLCSAVVSYTTPSPSDDCGANVTVTCTPSPGVFPIGTSTVTCLATNGTGQSAICAFTVTVRDTEPPRITACPTNRTLSGCVVLAPDLRGEVSFTDCDQFNVTVQQTPAPGTPLAPGLHNFVFNIQDSSGNGIGCLAQITVLPITSPLTIGLFNTGVDATGTALPVGATDTHYAAISAPVPLVGPIVLSPYPGWIGWTGEPASPPSRWINIGSGAHGLPGSYVYRQTLDLSSVPAAERGCLVLRGRWAADNSVEVWVNGVLKASRVPPVAYRNWEPLVLSGLPSATSVTLEFRVKNESGPSGLRVEWTEVGCAACNGCEVPVVVTQPTAHITRPGASVTLTLPFTVVATGTGPLTYQWYRNGYALVDGPGVVGANAATLTTTVVINVGGLLRDDYYCVVSNPCGVTRSQQVEATNFQIYNHRLVGGQLEFNFPTRTNGVYLVEAATSLLGSNSWQTVQTVTGNGAAATVVPPPSPGGGPIFFRIREWETGDEPYFNGR